MINYKKICAFILKRWKYYQCSKRSFKSRGKELPEPKILAFIEGTEKPD